MSYRFDSYDNSVVIEGWEKGISDNPFAGIADMRNANVISIPGEVSVGFSTSGITQPSFTKTISTVDTGANTFVVTSAGSLENGMAVKFSNVGSLTGISINTPYWLFSPSPTNWQLYTDWSATVLAVLGGTVGVTPTFSAYLVSQPKHYTYDNVNAVYYMVDSAGLVWSNKRTTASGYWIYTGNTTLTNAKGNGLVFYAASDLTGFVFVFRNGLIDYLPITGATPTWVYGWKPSDGTTGNTATVLKTALGTDNPHEAFVSPANQVIYCDKNWVGRWYEFDSATPFVPTNTATYTFDQTALLPATDLAQCLTYLGTNILVGGQRNVIYPWNGVADTFNYPILIAENNIVKMVTINTSTYAFAGNRGRVYITDGSRANLYKKVPDHISGTVEPYYTWGGATFNKNQLYFSLKATNNAGTAIPQYGGLWAIDVDTTALRLTNQLSYATYAGYATALIAQFDSSPEGTGLFIGWDDGASGYGLDKTIGRPYTGSQCTIDSDFIPIGTFTKPRDLTKIEYKLVKPLVSGESIVIKTRTIFDTQSTGYTTALSDSTVGSYSSSADVNFKNAQWVQFQIVLNSTASTPSYVRLKEIRILGLTP